MSSGERKMVFRINHPDRNHFTFTIDAVHQLPLVVL